MANLIIIGSGITGLLTAYYARKHSRIIKDITILEKEKNPSQNSLVSHWAVMPPLCDNFVDLCKQAVEYYKQISDELGIYSEELPILRYPVKDASKRITREKILELDPSLSNLPEAELLDTGLFVQGDELISELIKDNKILLQTNIVKPNTENNKIISVESSDEIIKGDYFVFATGYQTFKLFPSIKLTPLKGHMVITKKSGLRSILLYKGYLATEGKQLYLNGDVEQTDNLSIDFTIVNNIVNSFSEVIQNLDTTNITIKTGLRYLSQDGKPIVEKVYENAVVITGYRFGFAVAPVLVNQALKLLNLL